MGTFNPDAIKHGPVWGLRRRERFEILSTKSSVGVPGLTRLSSISIPGIGLNLVLFSPNKIILWSGYSFLTSLHMNLMLAGSIGPWVCEWVINPINFSGGFSIFFLFMWISKESGLIIDESINR